MSQSFLSTIHLHYSTYLFSPTSHEEWWNTQKTNITHPYTLQYLPDYTEMTHHHKIKDSLIQCATFLTNLSLEDTLLLYTVFTPAITYFNQYIHKIDTKLQSKEIRNDNRPDPSEAHHATLQLKDSFTLWPILYSILHPDELYITHKMTNIQFYQWCTNHSELTFEEMCLELSTKQNLKLSQIRFLGLELEEKCYSLFISNITSCLETCKIKQNITCFSTLQPPKKEQYNQFLSKEFLFFSFQQTKSIQEQVYQIKQGTTFFLFDLLLSPSIQTLNHISFPPNITKFTQVNRSIQGIDTNYTIQTASFPTKEQCFSLFSNMFKSDMLGWKQNERKPHWIVKGGFGLKALLEHKYKQPGLITTKDIDLNISIRGYTEEQKEALLSYMQEKVQLFIAKTGVPFLFKAVVYTFKPSIYFSVEKYNLHALLLIKYNLEDWIDIGFVDYDISPKAIDWNVSEKVGYPVKTSGVYMKEIVGLVYQSNVKGADAFTYKKRNPNTGTMFRRGRKDIERSMLMCEIDPNLYDKYSTYCDYVTGLTKDDFKDSQFNFEFLKGLFGRR